MAETFDIYDPHLAHIGEIPISPQQREQLHRGGTITMSYHTPRMLRELIGIRNGQFDVIETDNHLIVTDVEEAKRFIELQTDIARAMKQPDKWVDPDAESNAPVR